MVHVSEILRHFSQIYPIYSRSVYDQTGVILAILYREVSYIEYRVNASCKISA